MAPITRRTVMAAVTEEAEEFSASVSLRDSGDTGLAGPVVEGTGTTMALYDVKLKDAVLHQRP